MYRKVRLGFFFALRSGLGHRVPGGDGSVMDEVLIQAVSLFGSLLILSAFIAAQLRRMHTSDRAYVLLNLVGSGLLAAVAIVERQWGFLLLEGVWALVSAWSLVQLLRGRPPGAAH
jgi:hypothetical protein